MQQTATFEGDAMTQQEYVVDDVKMFESYEPPQTAVTEYLKRPVFIQTNKLEGAELNYDIKMDIDFYNTNFLMKDRFGGARGFRATTVFRVVVASTPQIGGRLRCVHIPLQAGNDLKDTHTNFDFMKGNRAYVSQLKGSEIDLQEETALEVRCPFVHYWEFFPLAPANENFKPISNGVLHIFSYLPILNRDPAQVPRFTVYAWLEDVEILGVAPLKATYVLPGEASDIDSQGALLSVFRDSRNTGKTVPEGPDPAFTKIWSQMEIKSQAGKTGKIDEDVERDGPLSGPLYNMGKAINYVGKAVPSLSSITGPLSWATRIGSNVVSAFGYARPLDLDRNQRFWLTQNAYQNNADGADTSFGMGLLQDNKVCVLPGAGGTDIDEMALAHLTEKKGAISYFELSTASTGRQCYIDVAPLACYYVGTNKPPFKHLNYLKTSPKSGTMVDPSPMFWLGTMFRKWRGGFRYTIKVNKTKFHAGRLMLSYTPTAGTDDSSKSGVCPFNSGSTSMQMHSLLWNLRESSEITFDIPYFAPTPYLFDKERLGTLTIEVVDPITGPDTVSQTLDFVVEAQALEGFEFAEPREPSFIVDPNNDDRAYGGPKWVIYPNGVTPPTQSATASVYKGKGHFPEEKGGAYLISASYFPSLGIITASMDPMTKDNKFFIEPWGETTLNLKVTEDNGYKSVSGDWVKYDANGKPNNLPFTGRIVQIGPYTFALYLHGQSGAPDNFDYEINLDLVLEIAGDDFSIDSQSGVDVMSLHDLRDKSCSAIGEKIMSVKQLISRSTWLCMDPYYRIPDPYGTGDNPRAFRLYPWFCHWNFCAFVENPGIDWELKGSYKVDTIDLVSAAYLFARGGTCYDIINLSKAAHAVCYNGEDATGAAGSSSILWETYSFLKAKAPFYSNTDKIPVNPAMWTISRTEPKKGDVKPNGYANTSPTPFYYLEDSLNLTKVGRRAADDCQLAYFLCTPRLRYVHGAFAGTNDPVGGADYRLFFQTE